MTMALKDWEAAKKLRVTEEEFRAHFDGWPRRLAWEEDAIADRGTLWEERDGKRCGRLVGVKHVPPYDEAVWYEILDGGGPAADGVGR